MKIKLTAQHKWILVLLAFILVNVAVWKFGLAPAISRVDAAKKELDQGRQRLDSLQQRLDQLNAICPEELNEQLAVLTPQVPEQGLLREFIHGLVDMANVMGMPLSAVTISSPAPEEPYNSVTLSTSIAGSYKQIKAFLIALEEHERLILIRKCSISGSGDTLTCSLSFSIFADGFEPLTPLKAAGRNNPFEGR